jgi:tRNA dimethylallyltransferase
MMKKQKIIVILGQTATGKSDFAVQVAKKIGGEIISADSRQVYKGLDIGTGKITKKEMGSIKHYLLDVATPARTFTVQDFKTKAEKAIKEIYKKSKVPIICGGTGFYIDALVSGQILPEVPPNKKLRQELYQLDPIGLTWYLEKLDPERAKTIDKNNKVRLIRAIEIAKALGKVPNSITKPKYDVMYIGLRLPDEVLKEKIHMRLFARIKEGMVKEVENLHKKGLSWERMNDLGLEYRYVSEFLQGKLTKAEMLEKLNTEIWHYAKRQKTWFKRNKKITWIDPREKAEKEKIIRKVKEFLD